MECRCWDYLPNINTCVGVLPPGRCHQVTVLCTPVKASRERPGFVLYCPGHATLTIWNMRNDLLELSAA